MNHSRTEGLMGEMTTIRGWGSCFVEICLKLVDDVYIFQFKNSIQRIVYIFILRQRS